MIIANPSATLIALFLSSFSVAGTAILWRKILADHVRLKKYMQDRFGKFSQAFLCGSCFTYWLSLLFILTFDPLAEWTALNPSTAGAALAHIFLSWMALSTVSLIFRFGFVMIQEVVHHQVHHLHDKNHS